MKKLLFLSFLLVALAGCKNKDSNPKEVYQALNPLRAPAYPLITIDPYTSAWAFSDHLYDQQVKHWTGTNFPLIGAIRVDGTVYRFMGAEDILTKPVVKTSEQGNWDGKYVFNKPADDWNQPGFSDSAWKSGPAAFGTKENEPTSKTQWPTEHIWVRRNVTLDEDLAGKNVYIEYSHDDDIEIYINGIEVVNTGNACKKNVLVKLPEAAVNSLKAGNNVIAAHCWNRAGNALLDFGLSVELPTEKYLEQTAVQQSAEVLPTRTIYTFACGPVDLQLTFTAPLLMDNLDLLSRPVNYITYDVKANDSKEHAVELYLEAGTAWALDQPMQESKSETFEKDGYWYLKTGSTTQNILGKKGDNVRIDWGYFYLCADKNNTHATSGENNAMRAAFCSTGAVGENTPVAESGQSSLAVSRSLGKVKSNVNGYFMLGYDDIYSIQYFDTNLRPYWNRNQDKDIYSQFTAAAGEYGQLMQSCKNFDLKLMEDAQKAGGSEYASLCALAYRQAISAHKLVSAPNGDLMFLSKENFSNGSIGTVDITYPSAPLFLLYNPELAKALMNHIFYYSESGKWTKPFAAHDIGTYPLANGQTYGGDMPVEESGNMLILMAAIAAIEGNAKYAEKHWETLTIWTNYLVEKGLDPENQLCTDDFAGHFAHNTNLSIKAILGIASYGRLAEMLGKADVAQQYTTKAKEMAQEWIKMADDGDHYRLTFDQSGTWSQKYNLVWNKLMKMGIFPDEVASKEIAYYLNKQNTYGLPLDNREQYTKADWIVWTATMAPDAATFEQFISPVYKFMNETTTRVPMSDWYWTDKPEQRGFQARSVVGGYFIKMLDGKMSK